MLPQIQGDHQSQLLFQGSGYEQQSQTHCRLPKSPVEVRRIISIRSMLVYLLRAVFIVQRLRRGRWESGSMGQSRPPSAAFPCGFRMPRLSSSSGGSEPGFAPQGTAHEPGAWAQPNPLECWPMAGGRAGEGCSLSLQENKYFLSQFS